MKRIAIIGAGGFVGSRIVEMSRFSGEFEVVPIVRSPKGAARLARFGPIWQFGDARYPERLTPLIKGCDAVVNVTVGEFGAMSETTTAIRQACVNAGVPRFIHTSSAEVFGRVEDPAINDDAWPSKHWMPYACAKIAAEAALRAHFSDPKVGCVILRPGLIWGVRSPWVEGPATEILAGKAFLLGGGKAACNLINVDNLIRQILGVVDHAPVSGCFNVSDDESLDWHTYYAALTKAMGVDFKTIHQLPGGPYRPSMAGRFADFKQSALAQQIKTRLSRPTKLKLARLVGKFLSPVTVTGVEQPSQPTVTRATWHLQNTVRKLPNAKYRQTFGRKNELDFAAGMAATAVWLQASGFTAA